MIYTYEWLERNGRLGNQLWQIAATIAFAKKDPGSKVAIRPDWDYRKYFSVPDEYFSDPKQYPSEQVKDGGTAYFQEMRYIKDVEDETRVWYRPSELSLNMLTSMPEYEQLCFSMADIPSCSIHVRRGDYDKIRDRFPMPTPQYYQNAVASVLEETPNTEFYVFSDDIKWCKKNFGTDRMHFIQGTPRPVEVVDRKGEPLDQFDLFAMGLCDRHIIANSTFSWWGAFLSEDRRVMYPSVWYGRHPSVRNIPWRNMIPETWVQVFV